MTRRTLWAILAAVFVVLDVWCSYSGERDDSFSETNRTLARTDTPAGAAVFTIGLAAVAGWYWAHIVRRAPVPFADILMSRIVDNH